MAAGIAGEVSAQDVTAPVVREHQVFTAGVRAVAGEVFGEHDALVNLIGKPYAR
jgi:hypothetical protein